MTWKKYILLSFLSIIILGIFTYFQRAPGYMDAEYYFGMGLRIANSKSLSEPYIWNYLTEPVGIPHPGFSFWMPLPAFLSAAGVVLIRSNPFLGAKIIFILLAVTVPALTMKLSWEYSKDERTSLLAGLLAIFPFLYSTFLGTTDSFGLMMVLGGVFFLLVIQGDSIRKYLFLGLIAGLFHLARADGAIWILACGLVVPKRSAKKFQYLGLILIGYLLIMGPWFGRNWFAIGYLMPPSGSRMLWLTEYNDLFNLNSSSLTFQSWFEQGLKTIIHNISSAFLLNLKTIFFVQGQIILSPFVIAGLYTGRKDRLVRIAAAAWIVIIIVMTVVFPFAGMRGGLFHSGAALQPMIWVLAAKGFLAFINWGERVRNWNYDKAQVVFGGSLILLLAGLSIFTLFDRVIGNDVNLPVWNQSYIVHQIIGEEIDKLDPDSTKLVMLNNPPGFYVATGKSAVVIPNGGLEELIAAAEKYGVSFLVLDGNHPEGLSGIFENPELAGNLFYLGSKGGIKIFQFQNQ
jgi:hypothetical protein